MKSKSSDREYDFSLVLDGVFELNTEVENAFFQAGCDDATLSVCYGRIYMEFSRSAPSLKDAILSAIRDVRAAGIGAEVLNVDECNLVTQAEIARRIHRSRQLVHQFVTGKRGKGFPPPSCHLNDDAPLWTWCEVSFWLCENNMIKQEQLEEIEVVSAINNALDLVRQKERNPALVEEITKSLLLN